MINKCFNSSLLSEIDKDLLKLGEIRLGMQGGGSYFGLCSRTPQIATVISGDLLFDGQTTITLSNSGQNVQSSGKGFISIPNKYDITSLEYVVKTDTFEGIDYFDLKYLDCMPNLSSLILRGSAKLDFNQMSYSEYITKLRVEGTTGVRGKISTLKDALPNLSNLTIIGNSSDYTQDNAEFYLENFGNFKSLNNIICKGKNYSGSFGGSIEGFVRNRRAVTDGAASPSNGITVTGAYAVSYEGNPLHQPTVTITWDIDGNITLTT